MKEAELAAQANYAIEEPVNYYFNRPLADVLVRFFAKYTPVTPNQVTFAAIIVGVAAGFLLTPGINPWLFAGALLFQFSQILDCVDGQLARLTGNSSDFGRLLDGAGDYIVAIAIWGGTIYGMQHSLTQQILHTIIPTSLPLFWTVMGLAFISIAVHSLYYDFIKTKFGTILKSGRDQTEEEHREQFSKYRDKQLSTIQKMMVSVYKGYSKAQRALGTGSFSKIDYTLEERQAVLREYRSLFRLWSWLGPNSHFTVITAGAIMGNLMLSVWIAVIPMNLYFLLLVLYTRKRLKAAPVR